MSLTTLTPRPRPQRVRPDSDARLAAGRDPGSWLLPALLLLGTALRLVGVSRYPFEQDELYTVIEARDLFHSPLHPGIQARPLYYLLQHPLLSLAPVSELSLRLLPLLFGVLGLWATWALGKRVFGTTGAAVATFLAAISPWHLHASGMARYWSLVYLLAALACLFLIRGYRDDRPADLLLAFACLVLGTATHPTFAFPMVGVALGLTLVRADGRFGWRWPSRRAWVWLWLPFAGAMAVAYLALKLTAQESAVHNWDGRGWTASLRLLPAMVEWMTPSVFVLGGVGMLACLFLRREPARRAWGAVALLGAASGMAGLLAASLRTSVYADYGISLLPLLFVSGGGLVALGRERMAEGGRVFAAVAAVLLLAGVLPSLASHLSDGMRFDYRPAFRKIASTAPGVTVLSTPIALQRHYAPELRGEEMVMSRAALDAALARQGDLWAVVPVRRYGIWMDDSGEAAAWVDEHCRLDSSFERPRFDFRLYRTDLYRCRATPEQGR